MIHNNQDSADPRQEGVPIFLIFFQLKIKCTLRCIQHLGKELKQFCSSGKVILKKNHCFAVKNESF